MLRSRLRSSFGPFATVRALRAVLAFWVLTTLPGCYILQQGAGQIAMLSRRQPIARVLQDPTLPPRMRDRLVLVWYARRYAERAIGLRASESYQDFVALDRDAASYVVAAAPRDSLEPYRWCFPVAGCLPYIGYFDRDDALREQRRLEALGYDVSLRGVSAYSLGGWLPDPVYSTLLEGSRYRVADTVIHELTHATVFVPGHARFNESLATFVGERGALAFLEERYGRTSSALAEARAEIRDQNLYDGLLHELSADLRALYAAPLSRAEKLRRREALFARARQRAAVLPFSSTRLARAAARLNNAVLATHATYHGDEPLFEAVYLRLGSDLRRFVAFVRDEAAGQPDPEGFLRRWLASSRR